MEKIVTVKRPTGRNGGSTVWAQRTVFLLPVSRKLQFSDNAAGIANGDTHGGNILCDNAPCPNDAAFSNGYPRQN